jgi:hypothetical protein
LPANSLVTRPPEDDRGAIAPINHEAIGLHDNYRIKSGLQDQAQPVLVPRQARKSRLRPIIARHSTLMLAELMIRVHFAISLLTNAASGCGPRLALSGMSLPNSCRRLRVFASSNALTRIACSLFALHSADAAKVVYGPIWAALAEWRLMTMPSRLSGRGP